MIRRVAHLEISKPPPSVNAMYVPIAKGRSILSKEGRAWKKMVERELADQDGIIPDPSYYRLDILIPGKGSRCDLPNYEKALTDALVKANKTPDDRYLVDYRLRFHDGNTVKIAAKTEDLNTWATIRNASKSLIRKLAKSLA